MFCFTCGKPATYKKGEFYYCDDHKPREEKEFDIVQAQMDLVVSLRNGIYDDTS
jgi:hypothetical protein